MRRLVIGCVMVALLGVGCERADDDAQAREGELAEGEIVEGESAEGDSGEDGDVEDMRFVRSEAWPDDPKRIVSLAPNVTEVLFSLGLGDRVVAVTRYCDWPEEAEELPTVGGMLDPDLEAILGAEPDVVLGAEDGTDHRLVEQFEGANLAYGFVAMDDVESVRRGIDRLGGWLDTGQEAREVVDEMDAELEAVADRLRDSLGPGSPSALMVYDRQPVVAAGPGTFGHELLELAGFENALGDDVTAYPVVDVETLMAVDPEFVVDVTVDADGGESERYWGQFDQIRAVRHGRVFHIDDPVMMRPGPRLGRALERLAEVVEES